MEVAVGGNNFGPVPSGYRRPQASHSLLEKHQTFTLNPLGGCVKENGLEQETQIAKFFDRFP